MVNKTDIAIVGNGATGLALALELKLKDPKLKIALIGPKSRQGSASTTAGAMLNCWGELTPGTFENEVFAERFNITESAMKMWPSYVEKIFDGSGIRVPIHWGTIVFTSPTGPVHELDNFSYLRTNLDRKNQPFEVIEPKDLDFLSPDASRMPSNAVKINDGRIDSIKLISALDSFMQNKKIDIFDDTVLSLEKKKLSWEIKLVNSTSIISNKVVLANGAYAREILSNSPDLKDVTLPLFFGAGTALDVELPAWSQHPKELTELNFVVRTMDRGGACGLHLIPLGDKRFYFGASSGVWEHPEKNHRMHAISWLSNSIERDFHHNFFSADTQLRGPGFRPVSLDGFPLFGEIGSTGVYMLNGTKRDGLTCSPFYAEILSEQILYNKNHKISEIFNPVRKAISYFSKEIAIDAAVKSEIGGETMHGLNLPPYRQNQWREIKYKKIHEIYEKRQIIDFGIHPELFHFYEYDTTYQQYVEPFIK